MGKYRKCVCVWQMCSLKLVKVICKEKLLLEINKLIVIDWFEEVHSQVI